MDAVLFTNGVLCLLIVEAALPPTVWGQATYIIELRESLEHEGTDHTGDIVSFTDVGSGAGSIFSDSVVYRPRPWICYTGPPVIIPTNVEWQTPDGFTIPPADNSYVAPDDSIVTRLFGGAYVLSRGTNYFSPDGDYCCVLTMDGTEVEKKCVTFTPCPTLDPPTYANGRITYNPDTNVATYDCVTGYTATITSGDQQRTCVSDGTSAGNWTGSMPTVTCMISIIELRESAEHTGTDHTGDIVSFTAVGSGAEGTSPRPWVCYTEPLNALTIVEWQTHDGFTIPPGNSSNIAPNDSVVTRSIRNGLVLSRGSNYFSSDGDYCCVLTMNGTESERRCVTFTHCPTLNPPAYANGRITYNPDTNVATYGCVTGYTATITSGDQQRTCVSNGTSAGSWTGSVPTVTCILPLPIVTPLPSQLVVIMSHSVSVTCSATSADSAVTVSITTTATNMKGLPTNVSDMATLSLSNVMADRAGMYNCTATNDRGSVTVSFRLYVAEVQAEPHTERVPTANNATLTCRVNISGIPSSSRVMYEWVDGFFRSPLADNFYFSDTAERALGTNTSTLTITNVGIQDLTMYSCHVIANESDLGFFGRRISIILPSIDVPLPVDVILTSGDNLTLTCVGSNPEGAVSPLFARWRFNATSFDEDDKRITTEFNGTHITSTLTIRNMPIECHGDFACYISNRRPFQLLNSVSNATTVTLLSTPKPEFVDTPYRFQARVTSRIRCVVNASPPALNAELVEVMDGQEIEIVSQNSSDIGTMQSFEMQYYITPTLGMKGRVFRCRANNSNGLVTIETFIVVLEFTGCPSGPDIGWNIQWPNTDPNTTATQPCPGELDSVTGEATRYCDVNGEWSISNVLNCQQSEFEEISANLKIQALNNDTEALIEETVMLTEHLAMITEPTSMSLLPSSLNTTNTLISTVLDVLETRGNNTATDANEFIIDVLDNILEKNNTQGWTGLQETGAGSQVLLENTERFAELLATSQNNSHSGEPVRISRPNIAVSATLFNSIAPMSVNYSNLRFPVSDDLLNFTNSSTVPAEIEIPAELLTERLSQLNGGILPVTFILLQNLETFLPSSASGLSNSSSASMIISSQVGPRDSVGQSVVLQDNPISINFTFSSVPNPNDLLCVFWNFSNPVGNGGWVSEGVHTVESTTDCGEQVTTVQCTSTHLTSFAVLVDVAGGLKDVCAGERLALQVVSYIGCVVSIVCLLVTVIFFITHGKKLLSSVHYFIHLNLALSLLLGYIVFVSGLETAVGSKGGCVFVAVLLHYFFLSAFCWMLCEGVMLYLLLVVVFSQVIKKWWFFLLIGYVTPLPFVVITLAVRWEHYGVRDELTGELQFCWLSTKEGTIFGFVVPMLLIILINVTFLVLALRVIWSSQSKSILRVHNKASESEKSLRVAKSVLFSSLVLLPLLGLTWVFGLLTIDSNTTVFAWIFTILNSLQGVAIFVFHVLRNDKVKAKLGPFCFTFKKITKRYKLFEPTSSTTCDASKYQCTEQGLGTLKSSVDTDVRIKEDLVSHQVSCELSETKIDLASESAIKYDKLITESETTPPTDEITTIENFVSKS